MQFMSLAEKRTKQMKGMGVDESDISDEALTSSSSSAKQQTKQEQVPASPAPGSSNGKATAASQPRPAGPVSSAQPVTATIDKKDKKGDVRF